MSTFRFTFTDGHMLDVEGDNFEYPEDGEWDESSFTVRGGEDDVVLYVVRSSMVNSVRDVTEETRPEPQDAIPKPLCHAMDGDSYGTLCGSRGDGDLRMSAFQALVTCPSCQDVLRERREEQEHEARERAYVAPVIHRGVFNHEVAQSGHYSSAQCGGRDGSISGTWSTVTCTQCLKDKP